MEPFEQESENGRSSIKRTDEGFIDDSPEISTEGSRNDQIVFSMHARYNGVWIRILWILLQSREGDPYVTESSSIFY